MTRDTLAELAERVEQAAGPDRELDRCLFAVLHGIDRGRATGPMDFSPTASLDAAMTLVPEGWWIQHLGQLIGGWACRIETNGPPSASLGLFFAPTAALTICAAALRSRAAIKGEG